MASARITRLTADQIGDLAAELVTQHPADILEFALRQFGNDVAFSFSGAEDVALIDMASSSKLPLRILTVDTGRLHPQTYRFLETVRNRYGVSIETRTPEPDALQALVTNKGYFSFYEDGHCECCSIRKVEPLRRALAGMRAYITGLRRDQSPATRAHLPVVQVDTTLSTPSRELLKFNPLAHWTSAEVWQYIREHDVPYNPLHDAGFRSIGCEPCTRPTKPGEHEREGRWWWEDATQRECGLHHPSRVRNAAGR